MDGSTVMSVDIGLTPRIDVIAWFHFISGDLIREKSHLFPKPPRRRTENQKLLSDYATAETERETKRSNFFFCFECRLLSLPIKFEVFKIIYIVGPQLFFSNTTPFLNNVDGLL